MLNCIWLYHFQAGKILVSYSSTVARIKRWIIWSILCVSFLINLNSWHSVPEYWMACLKIDIRKLSSNIIEKDSQLPLVSTKGRSWSLPLANEVVGRWSFQRCLSVSHSVGDGGGGRYLHMHDEIGHMVGTLLDILPPLGYPIPRKPYWHLVAITKEALPPSELTCSGDHRSVRTVRILLEYCLLEHVNLQDHPCCTFNNKNLSDMTNCQINSVFHSVALKM